MAKIFLVCTTSSSLPSLDISHRLKAICQEITPEIITPNPPLILERKNMAIAIANPVKTLEVREDAVCLGVMFDKPENWWEIGADIPDGNFALYRFNDEVIELAVDDCGSRNIWYYQDEEVFIASSSQRAIIQYLGSFEFNPDVVPWMLSEGAFLFGASWDKRIKPLPPS
ncbi:MAG: hypothetical protein KDE26_28045, partial [Bacteroidetes bacterium]|nr:hypothetical protein [Bacteroidota bacterium]